MRSHLARSLAWARAAVVSSASSFRGFSPLERRYLLIASRAVQILLEAGVPEILLTLGSEGAILYLHGGEDAIPVTGPVRDVQSTGAGDVFMVAYIAARSDGEEPEAAANLAAATVAHMLEKRKHS